MPFFSVIIPSYNRYDKLKDAIDSVLAQTLIDFQLIVVDDGSSDNTSEIADEYHGRLKYIRQNNSGVSAARNRGIEESDAEYITFLDSDDTWMPAKLEEQKKFIELNPSIQINQTADIWIRNGVRVNPGKKHIKSGGHIFLKSLDLCMISPSSVAIKQELFKKYGVFDTRLHACEDYDLWLRITAFEETGLIRKNLITRYAGHDDQLSSSFTAMDRFRIYAIIKLIKAHQNSLTEEYFKAARNSGLKKIAILRKGSLKRNNIKIAEDLLEITDLMNSEEYDKINEEKLLW